MATGTVGVAEVSFRARLDQLNRDLDAGRAATRRAAGQMAADLGKVEQQTKKIGESARRSSLGIQALSRQFLVLRAAISAAVTGLGIRAAAQAADAWALMGNRLRLVSGDAASASADLERLFAIAQRTRSDLGATVDFYFKLSNAAKELGLSQDQLFTVTENLNKLFRVGGVDAVRAAQATFQLTQAFTKQRIQGDELRTLHEAFPPLLNLIATQMTKAGKATTAQELATRRGGIAVGDFLSAIQSGGPEIQRQFATLTVTIGDAMTLISNRFTKVVGESTQLNGSFRTLVRALLDLERVIGSREFQDGFGLIAGYVANMAKGAAELTAAVGDLVGSLRDLGAEFDVLSPKASEFLNLITNSPTFFGHLKNVLEGAAAGVDEVSTSLETYNRVAKIDPAILQEWRRQGLTFEEIGKIIGDDRVWTRYGEAAKKALGGGAAEVRDFSEEIETITERIRDLKAELQAVTMEGFNKEHAAQIRDLATAAGMFDMSIEELSNAPPKVRELAQAFVDVAASVRMVGDENERAARAREELQEALAREADEHQKFQEETAAFVREERQEINQRIESSSELPDEIDAANTAAQGLATTLTDFENLSFQSLADSIAGIGQSLAEAAIQALIFRAIMGAFGGGAGFGTQSGLIVDPFVPNRHGNVFAGGRLKHMAHGGFITDRPMIMPMQSGGALIGEAGPEAVLPLKRMASGNLGVASEGRGGSSNVINIDARQSTPGTAAAAVNAAVRLAPGAVVNAQARGMMGRGKHPF